MRYDALIVGAGPAGATAAILLAKAGWTVAIVEKSGFPRRKVCGEFVSATSLPLLFELGIGERFLDQAGPEVRRVGLYSGATMLEAPMPRATNRFGAWGRALGREHLDAMLLDAAAAAGVDVWQPWTVTALSRANPGYGAMIAAGTETRQLEAPVTIVASGSWERGPHPMQVDQEHRDADLLGFKAHFTNSDLPVDLMPLLLFPGGYGGMVHTDGGRVSLSCCIRRDTLRRCRQAHPQPAGPAVLRHILDNCAGVDWALRNARLDEAWLSAGPIRPGIRRPFEQGLFAVGNAAGEAHPIVAEGISMAMQSSWLLCRDLIARELRTRPGSALDQAGREYAATWRRSFAGRIRAAAVFAQVAHHPRATALALHVLEGFPSLMTLGAGLSGKVREMSR